MLNKKLLSIICFLPLLVSANETKQFNNKDLFYKNRRAKYPVGVNLMAFGPAGVTGVSVDWFLVPKLNFELGAGLNNLKSLRPSYFAGGKYHFFGNTISNTTFYLGLFDKVMMDNTTVTQTLYAPFGIQRIKKNKLTWNIEVAYTYDVQTYKSQVWGAFKLGYRFNRFDRKKKKSSK